MQQDNSLAPNHWQASLNPGLMRRLLRSVQPGVMKPQFAHEVIARTQRLGDRLPLLVEFAQRQGGLTSHYVDQPLIVYAQALPPPEMPRSFPPASASQPPSGPPTVIQAKFAKSGSTPTPPQPLPVVQAQFSPAAIASTSPSPPHSLHHPPVTSPPLSAPASLLPSSAIAPPATPANPAMPPQTPSQDSPQAVVKAIAQISLPTSISALDITQRSPLEAPTSNQSTQAIAAILPIASFTASRPIVQAQQMPATPFQGEQHPPQVPLVNPSPTMPLRLRSSLAADQVGSSPANSRSLNPPLNDATRPRIQVSHGTSRQGWSTRSQSTQSAPKVPLVFTNPLVIAAQTYLEQEKQNSQRGNRGASELANPQSVGTRSPLISQTQPKLSPGQTAPQPNAQPPTPAEQTQPAVDLEALTKQVERRLMQRLVIESERRGQKKWR